MTNEIPKNNGGRAPKVLLVDVDYRRSGTTAIAKSDNEIKRLFGFPPIHIKSGVGFKKFMIALGKRVDIEVEYGVDSRFVLNPKFADVDVIVVDTLSGLQSFIAEEVRGAKSTMMQQDWGQLKAIMESYLMDFCNMPCQVICTSHTQIKEDTELGRRVEVPALSGATGAQLGKYFDNILFTDVTVDKSGKRSYKWQIAPSERRNCRGLPTVTATALKTNGLLEQDFVKLYELIRCDTIEPVTTLIQGTFGSGKTQSLRSLVNIKI